MRPRSGVGFWSQIFADLPLHDFPVDSIAIDKELIQSGGLSLRSITNGISGVTVATSTVAIPIAVALTVAVPISVTDWITVSICTMGHDEQE